MMDMDQHPDILNSTWKIVWRNFENASLANNLTNSENVTDDGYHFDEKKVFENPAKLGIVTGLLIAGLAAVRITSSETISSTLCSKLYTLSITTMNLFICFIFFPLVAVFLTLLFVYRKILEFFLAIFLGDQFGGLLEGTDCVWAVEDPSALSVINILAILELDSLTEGKNILEDFRSVVKKRLLSGNFEKLSWRREKKYGYYYWRKNSGFDDQVNCGIQVRWMDENHEKNCDGTCDDIYGGYLQKIIAETCNRPLPGKHSSCWEILVGRSCREFAKIDPEQSKNNHSIFEFNKRSIPVLFRVHHTVGDGVTLIRLLLEALADSNSSKFEVIKNEQSVKFGKDFLEKSNKFSRIDSEIIYYSDELLSASMPFGSTIPLMTLVAKSLIKNILERIDTFSFDEREILEAAKRSVSKFMETLHVVISIPRCFANQVLKSRDRSALHGPQLTGEKIISCWMESDFADEPDGNLLSKIREIKNFTGTRFIEVILAAISSNLFKYFYQVGEIAPEMLTTVIPVRTIVPSRELVLRNRFSVGVLPLCIAKINGEFCDDFPDDFDCEQLLRRLKDVSNSSGKLKKDSDYLINYWVMTWLSAALPYFFLGSLLQSRSTMIFSNLPGPGQVTIMGHNLRKLAFWPPHRGTTGLACSLLTYGGNVHFSLIADKAVISKKSLLDDILRGILNDINKLHKSITCPILSETSTESEAHTKTNFEALVRAIIPREQGWPEDNVEEYVEKRIEWILFFVFDPRRRWVCNDKFFWLLSSFSPKYNIRIDRYRIWVIGTRLGFCTTTLRNTVPWEYRI